MRYVKTLILCLGLLLPTLALTAQPASANHVCSIALWNGENYTSSWVYKECNLNQQIGTSTYWDLGPFFSRVASSLQASAPSCWSIAPMDDIYTFGPLNGPNHWYIAALAPYGWDNRFTRVRFTRNC